MDSTAIARIIKRYLEGAISDEETIILNQWRSDAPEREALFEKILDGSALFEDIMLWMELNQENQQEWTEQLKADVLQKIQPTPSTLYRQQKTTVAIYVAAAVLLIIGAFSFLQWENLSDKKAEMTLSAIQGGSNKAELVLSNGQKINLRSDKDGITLQGQLAYSDGTPLLSLDKAKSANITATIKVPKGGKYNITLADGSRIWLNAGSELEYPLVFDQQKRLVRLKGEAYFQVAKFEHNNSRVPFEVHSEHQTVEVTGTSFNISAYPDDTNTTTTLVEGTVTVSAGHHRVRLSPNEQAVYSSDGLKLKNVDVESFIAWKENKFLFYETELRDLMKSISRWYNIDVAYQGVIPPTYFYGEIGREKNLAEVLRILEKSGVKFKLKSRGTYQQLIVIQ